MAVYPGQRGNLAAALAQRNTQARQAQAAARPAPVARPTDPATGGFLPPPQRQGDALDQMYAQRAPMMQPSQPPPGPPGGIEGMQQSGASVGGAPAASFAGMGNKLGGGRAPPPGGASTGAVYDGPQSGTPAWSMGPPPPGGTPAGPKGSAASMGGGF